MKGLSTNNGSGEALSAFSLQKSVKRFLSVLLALAMILTMLPFSTLEVRAEEQEVLAEEIPEGEEIANAGASSAEEETVNNEGVETEVSSPEEVLEVLEDSEGETEEVALEETLEEETSVVESLEASDKIIQVPSVLGSSISFSYGVNGTNQSVTATYKADTTSTAQTLTTAQFTLKKVDDSDNTEYTTFSGKMTTLQNAQTAYVDDPSDSTKTEALVTAREDLENEPVFAEPDLPSFISYGGESHTGENGVFTFKTTARPLQVYSGKYVLKVADANSDNQPMYSAVFTVSVAEASITITPAATSSTDNNVYTSNGVTVTSGSPDIKKLDGTSLADGGYPLITLGSPNSVKMNYTVYDLAADKPSSVADKSKYIIGEAITLTGDGYSTEDGNEIKDLQYTFTKADGTVLTDEFKAVVYYNNAGTLTKAESAESQYLYNNNPLTVVVAPLDDLAVDATHPGGVHEAYLHITSASARTTEYIAKVSFTVGSDLELSIKEGDNEAVKVSGLDGVLGKITGTRGSTTEPANIPYLSNTVDNTYNGYDATDDAAAIAAYNPGGSKNPYILTSAPIGTSLKDLGLKVLASGGKGNVTISADGANFIADGIDGDPENQNKAATFSFKGAINQKAATATSISSYDFCADKAFTPESPDTTSDAAIQKYIEDHAFQITATSSGNTVSAYFIILPEVVDENNIEIDIDGDEIATYGSATANVYSWKASNETTDVTTSEKVLTITNKSAVDLTFAYAGATTGTYAGYTYKASNTTKASPLTVKAGESQTITIAPVVKIDGGATEANIAKANLTINGDGLKNTVTELNFRKAAAVFEITNPIENFTTITGGEVGVEYDGYQFGFTKDEAAIFASWTLGTVKLYQSGTTVSGSNGVWTEGTSYTGNQDVTVKLSDYGLTFNTATGEITGTPKKAGSLIIPVTAAYYASSANSSKVDVTVTVKLDIVKPTVGTALRVKTTSGESVVTQTATSALAARTVNMGDINKDAEAGKEISIEVENLTGVDIEGVKLTFDGTPTQEISKKLANGSTSQVNVNNCFEVIYSTDKALQAEYTTNGIKIPKNGSVTIKLVSKTGVDVASYSGTAKIDSGASVNGDVYFGFKLNVKDTPVISATNVTTGLTVGTEVQSSDNTHYFSALYSEMNSLTYNYSWVGKDGETAAQIADTWGLTLTSDSTTNKAYVRGKPKKAGELTVEVTATATTNAAVTTTKEFKITVAGNAKIDAKIGSNTVVKNSSTAVTGKTYVLPGIIVGETKTSTLTIVNDGSEKITGLTISVDDAFDDRSGTVKAQSDKTDIYKNSKDVITIATPSDTELEAGTGTATARITAAATAAGSYKVKVTISADNLAEQVFYVYVVASDRMTLDAPVNPVATVGVPTYLEVKALNTKQNVTWTEVTKADDTGVATTDATTGTTASNLKKAGFVTYYGDLNTNAGQYNTAPISSETTNAGSVINTSVALQNKGVLTGESAYIRSLIISGSTVNKVFAPVTEDSGATVTGIKISDYGKAAPTNAGEYNIYLKAEVAAGVIANNSANIIGHYAENGTAQEVVGDWINYNGTNANAPIAKQTAYTSIALTVNKSSAINITNVTSEKKATAPARTDYDTKTGITANKEGTTIKQVTAYTFKEAAEGYTVGDGENTIFVGITNSSKTNITANLTYDKTKFTVADGNVGAGGSGDVNGTITAGSTHVLPKVTLAAEKTTYIMVTPNATTKLAKGTHTDTLKLSGDNMDDVSMNLTFTVAEKTYKVDAEYIAENQTGYSDANYVTLRDSEALDKVVDGNAIGTGKSITLTPVALGGTAATNDTIFIRNTGNSAIASVEVVEVSAAGGSEVGSPSAHLLMYGVSGVPDKTSKATVGSAFAVTAEDKIGAYVTVKPNLANTAGISAAGEYDSFLRFIITPTTGADPVNIDIPVHFTVYAKDMTGLTVTPSADSEITLTEVNEGYAQTDFGTSGNLVVGNSNTGDTSNAFYGVTVTLEDTTNFEVVVDSENENVSYSSPDGTIAKITAGGDETVKVLPKKGLPAGTYTTAVIIKGGNLKSTEVQRRVINATIGTSTSFAADVYSVEAADTNQYVTPETINVAFAKRLFTALGAVSQDTTSSNRNFDVTFDTNTGTTKVVSIDLDKNGAADTTVTFTAGNNFGSGYVAANVSNITAVAIRRLDAQPLANTSYTIPNISITGAQDNTYFKSITFNEYSFITFKAAYEEWYVKDGVYDVFEKDNEDFTRLGGYGVNYKTKNEDKLITGRATGDTSADTPATNDNALFRVKVANGTSASKAFSSGLLPEMVYVDGSKKFENWQVSGAGKVTGATTVSDEADYVVYWHEHEYPATTKGNTDYITWTWSEDLTQATVTIKCLEGDGGELTFKSTDGDVTVASSEVPADCVKGKRTVYTATCTFGTAIYTDEQSTAEDTTTILGHNYKTTITWEKQADNSYKPVIKQVCTREGCTAETTNHEFTVTNSTTASPVVVEPTCTEKGKTTYTLTSYVDGNGKTITVAATDEGAVYEVEKDAKGHNEEPVLTVEDFDEETLKATVTATCPDCGTRLYGPEELTAKDNGDGTYTFTFVGTDGKTYDVTWANHEHNWSTPVWAWTPADEGIPTAAEATFTCSVGAETKTVAAIITSAVDGKYTDYTAKVTFAGKEYSDVITIDNETGKRTAKHEHVWGEPDWSAVTITGGAVAGNVVFTCTPADADPHTVNVTPSVKDSKADGNFTVYTLSVTDPAGKEYTKDITADANGNEVKGEAKTWTAEYAQSGFGTGSPSVTVTLTGDNGAVDKITISGSEITAKENADKTITYTVSFKDRAGKTHKQTFTYTPAAEEGGEGTVTPGKETTSGTDASSATGKISVDFVVAPDTDDSGNPAFAETGVAIKPAVIVRDEDRAVTLAQGVDYTLAYGKNQTGTGTVTVKGKGNYQGQSVSLSFTITALTQAEDGFAVKKIKSFGTFTDGVSETVSGNAVTYSGNAWAPESIVVTDTSNADVTLELQADGSYASEDGKTTAISIANNVNKGTATVTALNDKSKAVKKTFKIAAVDLSKATEEVLTFAPDDAVYATKGAVPANLNVKYGDLDLVLGQDYTVKYTYASKTKDAGEKAGSFVITGKGNFAKKATVTGTFNIVALELYSDAISVSAYDKASVKAVVPTVADGNGVAIPAKQLKVTITKHSDSGDDVVMSDRDKLAAGDEITVSVAGVNESNISGSADLDITVAANLAKAKVTLPKDFTKYYTGEPVELTDEDMAKIGVEVNKTVVKYGEDFEIAGYQNNIKKGNMTVIIRGISDKCSGTKTFKVKITAKTMEKAE